MISLWASFLLMRLYACYGVVMCGVSWREAWASREPRYGWGFIGSCCNLHSMVMHHGLSLVERFKLHTSRRGVE